MGSVQRALAACVGVLISLVFAAAALSCPTPPTGLWSGSYSGPYSSGGWNATVSVGPEAPVNSGVMSLTGSGSLVGNSAFGPAIMSGSIDGTINCAGFEQYSIDWSGSIGGTPVSGFVVTYTGVGQWTTASGNWEENFDGTHEAGTWFGTSYAAGGSGGTLPGLVEVVNPAGTLASNFSVSPVSPSQLPQGVVAPAGAIAFNVNEAPALGTIDVTLVLPPGSGPTAVYKSANGVYELYPASKTKISGNEITLELTDNELPWDENSEVGVIRDPVIPVEPQLGVPPTIKKMSSKKGPAGVETPVTITGTGFTAATRVKFGSTDATSFVVNSSTSISAVSPPGEAGTVEVSVATHNGVSTATNKDHFKFKKPKKVK